MSKSTNIVRTTITLEILHDKDLPIDDMSIQEIGFESAYGKASAIFTSTWTSSLLSVEELSKACEAHHQDPEFFLHPDGGGGRIIR